MWTAPKFLLKINLSIYYTKLSKQTDTFVQFSVRKYSKILLEINGLNRK